MIGIGRVMDWTSLTRDQEVLEPKSDQIGTPCFFPFVIVRASNHKTFSCLLDAPLLAFARTSCAGHDEGRDCAADRAIPSQQSSL
jgi:hypothetical protein